MVSGVLADAEQLWQAIEARDPRFDGWVFVGVRTTGVYCRPSCRARMPRRENVQLFSSAAAAQAAGFRACKRCRPDLVPGSPEWDRRPDLVGRAMRLIADGIVDREGLGGLARRLGYPERHVQRQLVAAVGAGPRAVARSQRAQTARILLETTPLSSTEVAVAAGFRSVRQFTDTIRAVFALTPSALRASARRHGQTADRLGRARRSDSRAHERVAVDSGAIVLRLPGRAPFDGEGLLAFFARRSIPGVEEVVGRVYRRSIELSHGAGVIELEPLEEHVNARFRLDDLRDLAVAIQRSRWLLDLDCDPHSVAHALRGDPLLASLVDAAPGRRVPGSADPRELAVRAVLGQQVSTAGAATLAARLTADLGEPLKRPVGSVTHLFPSTHTWATADPDRLPMPHARRRALQGLARALASGEVVLDAGADWVRAREQLLALPGVGPWTVEYIAMRALRDPDAFLPTDLGVKRALELLGCDGRPRAAAAVAQAWRPYRSYALVHLWAAGAARHPAATTADRATAHPSTVAA